MIRRIFVFGSNTQGIHGAGAAKHAHEKWGAKWGQARGLQGKSWAIVTKDLARGKRSVALEDIAAEVEKLIEYATSHPKITFDVSAIGCGLAGYQPLEVAHLFKNAPKNMNLPKEFRDLLI